MTVIQAIVYGIVQGVGEFLPISSTAHLILVPRLFGWTDPGTAFDVALHLGTAAAVIIFFFRDWISLIKAGFTDARSSEGKLFWFIVVATIPGGLAGVLLDKYMGNFKNPALIGVMLILMGLILYAADRYGRRDVELEDIGLGRSLIIGISQAFSIIPGVSRSGITMSTGRFLGMKRKDTAKFTFLLSTPIILADGLYHAKAMGSVPIEKIPFVVAVITSAVVGIMSIKFLLNYLRKKGFGIFVVYRFIIGAAAIAIYFLR